MELKSKVRMFLDYSGMSQQKFAVNVGCNASSLGLWLSDKRIISKKFEKKITDFLSAYAQNIAEIVNN
ncbi:MAG: helix-turn-helix transcriptional regulator [Ruminococcus sp.]|nr:helix-turn-helix transcriptional regulator [Ruminococcus sp.]